MVENTNKLFEALSKFQEDNVTAKKNAKNPFFKSDYANLDEVIQAVNQGAKYGLSFSQSVEFETHVLADKVVTTQFVRTNVYHKESDQCLTSRCIISVKGNKFDDSHAVGSAITYAKRYSLCAIYGLATEDDDGNKATMGSDKSGKVKENNSARGYTDPITGEAADVADDYPNISKEDIEAINKWIGKFEELTETSTYEDITTLTKDEEFKRLAALIKETKQENIGQYQKLKDLANSWGTIAGTLRKFQQY